MRVTRGDGVDRQTINDFWRAGLRYRPLLWLSILYPAGILLSNVAAPLFISKTLGALVTAAGTNKPQQYLLLFIICAGLGLAFNRIGHPVFMKHQALVARDLLSTALTTLLRRGVSFHNNNIGGKLVSDAIEYPDAYGQLSDATVSNLLPLAITLVAGSLIIYPESWQLGLFVTALAAIVVSLGIRDSRRMAPRRKARQDARKATVAHVADTITNVQTVKTFSREDYEYSRHERLNTKLTDIRINDWREMSTQGNTRMAILVCLQAMLVWVIILQVQRDPSLLGVGIFAFAFTLTLSNRLFEVNMLIRNIEESLLKASPMTKIIAEDVEIHDRPGATALRVNGGRVDFRDVTFAYRDSTGGDTVFEHLDLHIAAGEKIGLVGPSGGGKSTLTRLLLRFDDINAGAITVDGQDIAGVTQASLRQAISYVPQEPLLFHRTIRENIAYGRPDASLAAVRKAAKLAHADEFISKFQDGYDTIVGERGVKLSGGQRQRVAIARALLKDAPLLVLDEATSALDSESELLIQDALWKLMEGRTAIVVAHRLSTIQKMDRIVVLDGGRVVEQGTHQQLLAGKGMYAKLWSHQSGGFITE